MFYDDVNPIMINFSNHQIVDGTKQVYASNSVRYISDPYISAFMAHITKYYSHFQAIRTLYKLTHVPIQICAALKLLTIHIYHVRQFRQN